MILVQSPAAAFRPEQRPTQRGFARVCTAEEWEDEGQIHANAKRQHLNPSNDGLDFLCKHIPEQNPIVHKMHIFIKFVVISRFFKSRNSYAEKGGAQERLLAKRRKIENE